LGTLLARCCDETRRTVFLSPSFVSDSMILDLHAASVKRFRDLTDQLGSTVSMITGAGVGGSSTTLTAASIARAAASSPASVRA
jgi:hypothetical protein